MRNIYAGTGVDFLRFLSTPYEILGEVNFATRSILFAVPHCEDYYNVPARVLYVVASDRQRNSVESLHVAMNFHGL